MEPKIDSKPIQTSRLPEQTAVVKDTATQAANIANTIAKELVKGHGPTQKVEVKPMDPSTGKTHTETGKLGFNADAALSALNLAAQVGQAKEEALKPNG